MVKHRAVNAVDTWSGNTTARFDPRVYEWLFRRAADEDVSLAVVIRRAIDRELVANPITSDPDVNAGIVDYLKQTNRLQDVEETLRLLDE